VVVPIPAAPDPSPPTLIASAVHVAHRKHEPAHAAGKPVVAAAPMAAAPVAAAAASPAAAPPAAAKPATAPKGAFAEGQALLRNGDVDGALAKFQEAARANPSDAKAQKEIGRCYNRLGQRDRAQPYLKRYLELAPDAPDAAFIRAMLEQK
jgi:Flp pilus assembly protein TadD